MSLFRSFFCLLLVSFVNHYFTLSNTFFAFASVSVHLSSVSRVCIAPNGSDSIGFVFCSWQTSFAFLCYLFDPIAHINISLRFKICSKYYFFHKHKSCKLVAQCTPSNALSIHYCIHLIFDKSH